MSSGAISYCKGQVFNKQDDCLNCLSSARHLCKSIFWGKPCTDKILSWNEYAYVSKQTNCDDIL